MNRYEACRLLGVTEEDGAGQIRTRYRLMMKKYHPDASGADESGLRMSQMLTEAYRLLKTEGYLSRTEEEQDWGIRRNPAAFAKRTILIEEEMFGTGITVDSGIRGKYFWDPEIETFSMLLKSVGAETARILEPYVYRILSEERYTQLQAKLLHLLLQEFIDPYGSLKVLAAADEENGGYRVTCHLRADKKVFDPEAYKKGYPVWTDGNHLMTGDENGCGRISFVENAFYYVVTPLVIQRIAETVFLPDVKTVKGRTYTSGKLIIFLKEATARDMTESINAEIRRMLARI